MPAMRALDREFSNAFYRRLRRPKPLECGSEAKPDRCCKPPSTPRANKLITLRPTWLDQSHWLTGLIVTAVGNELQCF